MARSFTVAQLALRARQLADQVGASYVKDPELYAILSESYGRWYDMLLLEDPDFFANAVQSITATGATQYAFNADFGSLLGVDRQDGTQWINLHPFMITERNLVDNGGTPGPATRYRMNGENVELRPTPADGSYRVLYHAVPVDLTSGAQIINGVAGWERLMVLDAAVEMRLKEGTDPNPTIAQRDRFWAELLERISRRQPTRTLRIRDVYAEGWSSDGSDFWPRRGTDF